MSQEKIAISRKQILGARGLLEITQLDLATSVGLSERAMNMIESGRAKPRKATLAKIRAELERRGIEFINGRGVLLKKPGPDSPEEYESAGE